MKVESKVNKHEHTRSTATCLSELLLVQEVNSTKSNQSIVLLFLPFKRPRNRSLPNKSATIRRQNSHFSFWNINIRPKGKGQFLDRLNTTSPQ